MYGLLRDVLLSILRVPLAPPEPPAGSPDSVRTFRASKRFLTYRMVVAALIHALIGAMVGAGVVAALVEGKEQAALVLALVLLVLLTISAFITYLVIRIDYEVRYYIVTDRSLRVREGAFVVNEMTLTYANVQNLRIVQGPIMHLLKIWDLKIDTAGGGGGDPKKGVGGGHAAAFAGIDDAREVRDLVFDYLRVQGGGSGLGDLDDREDGVVRSGESRAVVAAAAELLEAVTALRKTAEAGTG